MSKLILEMREQYEAYLHDESKYSGKAEWISFPETEMEVAEVLEYCRERNLPVTVQGSRTGITGGAVPESGMILNMSKMNRITRLRKKDDTFLVEVQPGVLLSDLKEQVQSGHFQSAAWSDESLEVLQELRKNGNLQFIPAPTETTATIGGMASTNAKGISLHKAGRMAGYVESLNLVLMDGQIWNIERGQYVADETGCCLPDGFLLPCAGKTWETAPMTLSPGQDLIDLIVGSEGVLGVITSLELRLDRKPAVCWGLMFFWEKEEDVFCFLDGVERLKCMELVLSVEYFDRASLSMVETMKKQMTSLKCIPDISPESAAGVYIELETDDDESAEMALGELLEFFVECGGVEELTWAAVGEAEMEKFRHFRHAVPEGVNQQLDILRRQNPNLYKMGVDFRRKGKTPGELITLYQEGAAKAGVKAVIFGHAMDLHFHVNILPEDEEQLQKAKELLERWADETVSEGGILAAEHGIGKVKAKLVCSRFSPEIRENMKLIKEHFDKDYLLNRGNMGI